LLIEPCILLNIISIYSTEEFDKYIRNGTNDIFSKNLSHWNYLLQNSYKTQLSNSYKTNSISSGTAMSNALQLRKFLSENEITDINIQEKYLKDYPYKIKFIENFNPIN